MVADQGVGVAAKVYTDSYPAGSRDVVLDFTLAARPHENLPSALLQPNSTSLCAIGFEIDKRNFQKFAPVVFVHRQVPFAVECLAERRWPARTSDVLEEPI